MAKTNPVLSVCSCLFCGRVPHAGLCQLLQKTGQSTQTSSLQVLAQLPHVGGTSSSLSHLQVVEGVIIPLQPVTGEHMPSSGLTGTLGVGTYADSHGQQPFSHSLHLLPVASFRTGQ